MLEIAAVVLVYAGGLTVLAGLAGLAKPLRFIGLRRRRAGALVLGAGLAWIRSPRLGGNGRESILNAPEDQPILGVALRSGFVARGDEPGREVVFGTAVRLGSGPSGSPRYARTAMNFLVDEEGEGWCRLGTETRVLGTDDGARHRFAVYWRVIYPGSALIRRMWLQAIKRRAEAS